MVEILRKSIKAERTGHWVQHLEAVAEMLPYMEAYFLSQPLHFLVVPAVHGPYRE